MTDTTPDQERLTKATATLDALIARASVMSDRFQSAEERLRTDISNAKPLRVCTAQRCALQLGISGAGIWATSLTDYAKSVGFSEVEASGIMDGWDVAKGQQPSCTCHRAQTGYDEGFALGKALYANYKGK